jgi:uncharacterized protein (TIGR00661 family)
MKILYGVQGTGNGHISRARMMARYFSQAAQHQPLQIDYLLSGREPDKFFDMDCFGKYQYRQGLTFVTKAGSIQYFDTLRQNNIFRFIRDIITLDVSSYDLIISDFEPVTAWAGRLTGKSVLGIGHQYAFSYAIPVEGYHIVARNIMRYFAPANISVGLHWHHFGHPILPPIIDKQVTRQGGGNKVLVYLPFEDQQKVTEMLNRLGSFDFVQYAPELIKGEQANVSLRKTCLEGFKKDLASCEAVICNAGFELVSECLNLGIAVLVKPLKGQMEQLSNAEALRQLAYGQTIDELSVDNIGRWLRSEKTVPKVQFPDVAESLVDWILQRDYQQPRKLCEHLWQDVG